MSFKASNWAWRHDLRSPVKIVLLRLADTATPDGIVWLKVSVIAAYCCMSQRSVRRYTKEMVEKNILKIEPRYRNDGSCTSNNYLLNFENVGELTIAGDKADKDVMTTEANGHDSVGHTRTITESLIESPQQPVGLEKSDFLKQDFLHTEIIERLLPVDAIMIITLARQMPDIAQQLIDELCLRIQRNEIKSPIAYMTGIIKRAKTGSFIPSVGTNESKAKFNYSNNVSLSSSKSSCDDNIAVRCGKDKAIGEIKKIKDQLVKMGEIEDDEQE